MQFKVPLEDNIIDELNLMKADKNYISFPKFIEFAIVKLEKTVGLENALKVESDDPLIFAPRHTAHRLTIRIEDEDIQQKILNIATKLDRYNSQIMYSIIRVLVKANKKQQKQSVDEKFRFTA